MFLCICLYICVYMYTHIFFALFFSVGALLVAYGRELYTNSFNQIPTCWTFLTLFS